MASRTSIELFPSGCRLVEVGVLSGRRGAAARDVHVRAFASPLPGAEDTRRIQPLVDAGFVVEGVSTPALALTAVARAQRDAHPGSAAAYVALTERSTCLAIIRDGVLLFSREMTWGHDGGDAEAVGA